MTRSKVTVENEPKVTLVRLGFLLQTVGKPLGIPGAAPFLP
jgi:hypothetical protein